MKRYATASLALSLAAVVVAACDLPTEAPILDGRWVVPGDETTVDLTELLPEGLTVTDDGGAFDTEVDPGVVDRALGELCPRCRQLDGFEAPKPGFTADFRSHTELPEDMVRAELGEGAITIRVENGFGFDPIRPGDEPGTVRIELVTASSPDADGRVLSTVVLDGAEEAMPPGETVSRTVSLEPGVLEPFVRADVHVSSPEGDPVQIDADETLRVTSTVDALRVSSAEATVSNLSIRGEAVALGVEDVDAAMVDRIRSGDFVLDADNPWSAEAALVLRIRGPGFSTISKQVTIPGGSSSHRVSFTGDELRSFLGRENVTLQPDGVANGTSGPVTLVPGQVLRVRSDLDATLRIGG